MNKSGLIQQPTWKEWIIIKNISICKDMSDTYKKKWAERIGADHKDPTFARALNILERNGIADCSPWIGRSSMVKINQKKLDEFIERSYIYKQFRQYVYAKEFVIVGV